MHASPHVSISNRGYAGHVPESCDIGYTVILPCYEWIRYQVFYSDL